MLKSRGLRVLLRAAGLSVILTVCASCRELTAPSPQGDDTITAGHTRLIRALEGRRLTEPRFVGGFSYARCVPSGDAQGLIPAAGCSRLPDPFSEDFQVLREAEQKIRQELEVRRGPATLRASAVEGVLVRGERRAIDRPIERLEEAVAVDDTDAGLFSDLAAAYMVRAQIEDKPLELVRSLSAAGRAVELDPQLSEARFNHALALQLLYLTRPAIASWQKYLELDSGSAWAYEARLRIGELQSAARTDEGGDVVKSLRRAAAEDATRVEELVRSEPIRVRGFAEKEVFADWASAVLDGNEEETARKLAENLGKAFAKAGGDPFFQQAAARLRVPEIRQEVAQGHRRFSQGLASYAAGSFAEADHHFAESRQLFADAGSPFAVLAHFQSGLTAYRLGQMATSYEISRRVGELAVEFPDLRARAAWLRGSIELERVKPAAALAAYHEALAGFEATGELSHQASIHSLLANTYRYLADPEEAWRSRYRALQVAAQLGGFGRLPVILGEASRAASQAGEYRIATTLQAEALALDLAAGDPAGIAESSWWGAMIHFRGGDLTRAWEDLARAESACSEVPGEADRERILAGLRTLRGAMLRPTDASQAVELLSEALRAYQAVGTEYLLVDIFLERARAHLALGRSADAEADLEQGIRHFEQQRERLHGVRSQIRFFDRAEEVVEEMVRFQLDRRGDPVAAFSYAERAKARGLLDVLGRDGGGSNPLADLQEVLAEDQALIEYLLLEERTLAWVVTREDLELVELPADFAQLHGELNRWLATLGGDASPAFLDAARTLGEMLWEPLRDRVAGFSELILVPDRILHGLPFAALVDPVDGRFLVEGFTLRMAPSAATYRAAMDRVRPDWSDARLTALAVGDPAPAESLSRVYPRLPYAREEAEEVARTFPGSLLLTGDDATAERFLAEMDRFDVLHLATHAVANSGAPFRSKILFAPSPTNHVGEVFAEEIVARKLSRPQLVVLSACSTAAGHSAELEGTSDLGRAFIAAGVPATLVTQWDVADVVAREFFGRFYTHLAPSVPPAEALRRAQLDLLQSSDSRLRNPSGWAGFQLVGADLKASAPKGGHP